MAVLVDRATNDLLIGPDWGLNLEICDAVNYNPSISRDVVKALRKKLTSKNARVQILVLTILEMVMKNCGDSIHQMVGKDVLHDMVKIVKKKADPAVRDKMLTLIESWQKAFGGATAKYPQYSAAYDELRRSRVQFPVQSVADPIPLFSHPVATQPPPVAASYLPRMEDTTTSLTQLAVGLPSLEPAGLDEVLAASENSVWSSKDLDGAQRTLEVLFEMLNALDPGEKQAVFSEVIGQLVEQCSTNQKMIRQMVNSTSDEGMLFRGLALNDNLEQVLVKHSNIVSQALAPTEFTPGAPTGLTVYDNEDDEAEDELSHLAHRSSSRSNRISQENGLHKENGLHRNANAQPALKPSTALNGISLGQDNVSYSEGPPHAAASGQVMSNRGEHLSEEPESMVNPFAKAASSQAFPSNGSFSSATGSSSSSLDSSKLAAFYLTEKIPSELDATAYKVFRQASENVWSSESPLKNQEHTSQASDPLFDDDMLNPTASWEPVVTNKGVFNLPPPPIFSSERERFFEEKRYMNSSPKVSSSLAPNDSMERRLHNLNLSDTKPDEGTYQENGLASASHKFQSKPVAPAPKNDADQLFNDLVDLRSMRTNYKSSNAASSFSRPKGSGGGGM